MGACIIIVGCVFGSLVRQRGVLQSRLYSRQDDSITCLFFFYLARRSVGEVPEALPNFAMLFFFPRSRAMGIPRECPAISSIISRRAANQILRVVKETAQGI